MELIPVILSGGSGTRLWPLSTPDQPKQLHRLLGEQTLLQQTVQRLSGLEGLRPPLMIANALHRFQVAQQLLELGMPPLRTVLEPVGRNTAPAVAVAALLSQHLTTDPLLLVLPSDHHIAQVERFRALVLEAIPVAEQGALLTFGITPTHPETGYGYIRAGAALPGSPALQVDSFVEKPALERARAFLASGQYLWNSGMFLFRASSFLGELERLQPALLEHCRTSLSRARTETDFVWLEADAFARCPALSIDYAVMEHTDRAAVVPASGLGWSDIGSWTALAERSEADAQGNVRLGEVLALDCSGCYFRVGSRPLAALGLQDLVVVETPETLLIVPKERAQEVRRLAEAQTRR